jgi:hypothetical protein
MYNLSKNQSKSMLQSLQLIYVWYPSTQIWVFGCCCWSHIVENLIPFYANLSFWVLSLEPYCWESDTLLFKFEFWGVIFRTILLRIWFPFMQIWVCGCYPQNHIVENLIPFYANLSFWVLSSEPYCWESDTLLCKFEFAGVILGTILLRIWYPFMQIWVFGCYPWTQFCW